MLVIPVAYRSGTRPRDFPSISSNLLFPSGDGVGTIRCFTVRIYDDTRVENDEYFTVSLSNTFRTPGTATINILDNDGESFA
jgi:hypothetical protein